MADEPSQDVEAICEKSERQQEGALLALKRRAKRKAKQAQEEKEQQERLARLQAKRAEEEEEEEEDTFLLPNVDDAQADAALGLQEDPEPPSCEEGFFNPLQQPVAPALDFAPLSSVLHSLHSSAHPPAAVFQALLDQQLLLTPTPQHLQLLFQAAVQAGNEVAAQQLEEHYRSLPPGTAPGWGPGLDDFLCGLKDLGYTAKAPASQHMDTGAAQQPNKAGTKPQHAAGTPAQQGDNDASAVTDQLKQSAIRQEGVISADDQRRHRLAATCMQGLLQLLHTVCELELQHKAGKWVDFSRANKEAGIELLMALLQLHLVPSLCRVVLLQLDSATASLVQAWSECSPGSWDKTIVAEVAERVAKLEPSYMAALTVIKELPDHTRRGQQLKVACLLTLQSKLKARGGAVSASDAAKAAKAAVSGEPGVMAWEQLQAVADKGSKLKDAVQHAEDNSAGSKPDYYRMITLLECTHMVLWCRVYQQEPEKEKEREEDRATAYKFFVYLQRVNASLGVNRNATVAKLLALLAEWQNKWEFTADIKDAHAHVAKA